MLHSVEGDIYCIRVALGGQNTTMQDIEEVWAVIEEEGEVVLREWKAKKAEVMGS